MSRNISYGLIILNRFIWAENLKILVTINISVSLIILSRFISSEKPENKNLNIADLFLG